jgi:hypothetical protein
LRFLGHESHSKDARHTDKVQKFFGDREVHI